MKWPHDNQAERNAFYGDPAKGEIPDQLVAVVPPFAMYFEGKPVNKISFHKKAAPALQSALNEIWQAYGRDQKRIDAAGVSKYAGAYNHRMVRGSTTKWSNHAYACAIDLNAEQNGLGVKGNMPQPVIDAFCRQGWMWGGWYKGRLDPMHFEAVDNGGRVPSSASPVAKTPVVVAPPKPVTTATKAAGASAVVIAGGAAAAAQQGVSAIEIIAWVGGISALAGAAIIIGYKIIKGEWPWTSTGNQSLAPLPLSLLSSEPSLALDSAQLALSSAGLQATPSLQPSASKKPRKRSAKPSPRTRRPRKSSKPSKPSAARKSSPKRKSR